MNTVPRSWSKPWLAMWAVATPVVIVSAFLVPFWLWVIVAVAGFGVPEAWSVIREDDSYPPLTHAFRHFVPNWVAFPAIYGATTLVAAHWLSFTRPWSLAIIAGLIGWLTDHFTVTYSADDPYPFLTGRSVDDDPKPG